MAFRTDWTASLNASASCWNNVADAELPSRAFPKESCKMQFKFSFGIRLSASCMLVYKCTSTWYMHKASRYESTRRYFDTLLPFLPTNRMLLWYMRSFRLFMSQRKVSNMAICLPSIYLLAPSLSLPPKI